MVATKPIRFLMIGGFLGAGKTTTIARLARHYTEQGLKVGLVTNDQAYDLVDTHSLRGQGFDVGEVPGACFCCKFNDLVDTAAALSAGQRPDIIITEPVGSCTDLVATVIQPLRHLHGDAYTVAPLAVLLKPEHGRKILGGDENVGFSPKAAYIFLKQIEEASIVVLNKIDKLADTERRELEALVRERFPESKLVAMSATSGEGFGDLLAALDEEAHWPQQMMEVDYQVYAEGEAELGWLNCTANFSVAEASQPEFSLDELVMAVVRQLATALAEAGAEPAHLKVLGHAGKESAIANLVGGGADVDLSLASEIRVPQAALIINARVATDPALLVQLVQQEVDRAAQAHGLQTTIENVQHFRPSPPVPTHRMT